MSDEIPPRRDATARGAPSQDGQPNAQVRRRSPFSIVWLLPLIAAVIGGYIAVTTLSQRGPEVVITFNSADGLTAGQTRVRHKAVDLGTVNTIALAADMTHVLVHVRMNREATPYLTDKARFWVVRPRLSASSISGLETLLSGGYIEMDPGSKGGGEQTSYTGLETPPGIRSDEPGTTFSLRADRIGSIGSGSLVFYRDIAVGEVLGYHLPAENGPITFDVFVRAPYDKWVRTTTRFWNASGISLDLGGQGLHLELQSIQAVLSGGVAFGTAEDGRNAESAKANAEFTLYETQGVAEASGYKQRIPFVLYFESSTSGLARGSPVQIFGNTIGTVNDVQLQLNPANATARVRVAVEIQPERLLAIGGDPSETPLSVSQHLVDRGMRAQLSTLSYITGALAVSFEFAQDQPHVTVQQEGNAIVLPTEGGGLGSITTALSDISNKLDQIPFAAIGSNANGLLATLRSVAGGPELKSAIASLSATLTDVQGLVKRADAGLTPLMHQLPQVSSDLQQTLSHTNHLVGSVEAGYGANSQFSRDLERLMSQLNDGMRSVRLLADFLDRHPEALIRGRANTGAER